MIIGITGKSGSGKTFYSQKLNIKEQYHIIDVDKMVEEILKRPEIKNKLSELYGNDILEHSEIDRKRLGELIFSSEEEIKKYNHFIWKYIKEELIDFIQHTKKDIIIDWALLPLSDFFNDCDMKILVQTDSEIRKKRVMKRDNISEKYFLKRDQHSLQYHPEDYDIVANSENLRDLEEIKEMVERRKRI